MRIFDIADHLNTDEEKAGYLLAAVEQSLQESDWSILGMAIKDVAAVEKIDINSATKCRQINPEEMGDDFQIMQSPVGKAILELLQTLKPHFPAEHSHGSSAG